MAFPPSIVLLFALAATACGTASADDLLSLGLPLLDILPSNCGSVRGVQEGDTCESLAAYGGIDLAKYTILNPLALCGILTPAPGTVVCVGDKLAGCSNVHRTVAGDTCSSIEATLGTIVGGDLACSALAPDTPVCVRPGANQCDVDSLCGVPLTAGMRELLGQTPDWCTVLRECQAPLSTTTINALPSLMATLGDVTPAVAQVAGNEGHPELREFVKQRTAGPAELQIAFVPNVNDGAHASNIVISSGGNGRKLMANRGVSQMRYPKYRYYR